MPGGQGRGTRGEFLKRGQDNQEFVRAVNLEKEERFVEDERIYREVPARHPDNVSAMRLWARLGTRQQRYEDAEVQGRTIAPSAAYRVAAISSDVSPV